MALHFVTSAQAEDHIYSSDDARKTEGMIGSGGFVLGVKNKLSASMIDANTLRILEGDIIFCGRHVNINNYEEVTIQNGTPGMNSIALVVLSLKTDPSEEATIKVYEGEETEGDPVTPEYIQGDLNNGDTEAEMPLYTITKTGLSVGDPVAQFEVWVSEKDFRDSVSQDIDDLYYKPGDSISLDGVVTSGYITSGGTTIRFLVPLDKPLSDSVTTATSSAIIVFVRSSVGFLVGSSSEGTTIPADQCSVAIRDVCLQFVITLNSDRADNNTPVAVLINSGTITFS